MKIRCTKHGDWDTDWVTVNVCPHCYAEELVGSIKRCPVHHKDFTEASCPDCVEESEAKIEITKRKEAFAAQASLVKICSTHGFFTSRDCAECRENHPRLKKLYNEDGGSKKDPRETEFDPNGKAPSDPGSKLDGGKLLAGELVLSFPHALEALVTVATYGAGKYSRHGFLQVPNAEVRYLDACMRHLLKYGQGEHLDPESGLPHIDHALWNVAAIVELGRRKEHFVEPTKEEMEVFCKDYPAAVTPTWKDGAPGCPHTRTKLIVKAVGEGTYRQCLGCGARKEEV